MEGVAQLKIGVFCLTPAPSTKGINAITVHRRTGSKADTNVALEAQVVAARELEGIETSHEHFVLRVVFPIVKNGSICGTAVGICHFVLRFFLVVHSLGNTAASEPTIDFMGLHCDFEQKVITDLGTANFLAIHCANLHLARGRRPSVGNGSRCCDHADVEAKGDCFFACVVDTLDVIGPGPVRHQLGMLLDDKDESSLSVDVHQTTSVEEDLEVHGLLLAARHDAPALRVLAVALDIDDPIEAVQQHQHLDPICQAHHIQTTRRDVHLGRCRSWRRRNASVTTMNLVIGISNKIWGAHTDGNVVCNCAGRAGPTDVARWCALACAHIAFFV